MKQQVRNRIQGVLCGGSDVFSNLCHAIPGVNFVDVPDVVLPSVDGEQAGVRVIELKDRLMSSL